ncbi:hypothetical protein BC835DRAFT_1306766 [Cytidiella melzeri]|nr:hypothetical protein BC835DRAFT_1306766 [Cytidiella melzeri]
MDILRAINAFTTHADVPQYAITYYTIVRWDLDIIQSTAYVAMTIVSNGLIASVTPSIIPLSSDFVRRGIERFLALLIAADISLGAYAVYLLAATRPGSDALAGRVTDRVKWFYAVTLVVNLICTVLIALKIWKSKRAGWFRMRGWMPGDRLILVVVESAAVYSLLLIIMIVMSALGASGMLAMLNLIAPIISQGIIFSMVIIRVSVDRTQWDSLKISTHLTFVMSTAQGRPRSRHRRSGRLDKAADAAQQDGMNASLEDLKTGVGAVCVPGLCLHMGMVMDDSGFGESITSEKYPLLSIRVQGF